MRGLDTTVTRKGQVTVPVEIRARLGLKPKDKVRFTVDGASVTIQRAPSRIARHFGAVQRAGKALDWRAEREAFEEGIAEDVALEGQ